MEHTPLWAYTWPEVVARGEAREVLTSWEGHLISSKDRAFDPRTAKTQHRLAVARAVARGHDVPAAVRAEYETEIIKNGIAPDHARRAAYDPPPPAPGSGPVLNKKGVTDSASSVGRPLNAKGKPFSWSYTALTNFEGCSKRYAHEKFWCDVAWVDTPAIIWGNRVHKAGEDAVKGKPVPDAEAFAQVEKYVAAFLKQRALGAEVLAEMEIALTRDLKPVSWFSKEAWFRCKLDVTILRDMPSGETQAFLYDYKTGKVKDDPDQLKICAAALSVVRPEIETYIPKFIWTKDQTVTGCDEITAAEIPGIWEGILGRVARMEQAWASENFPARPSGLCPWCAVYDRCEYAKRRK